MSETVVLIFAKYPEPGDVKTRMVPPLSPNEAAVLHRASLLAVCERVRDLMEHEAIVVGTPDERLDELREDPVLSALEAVREGRIVVVPTRLITSTSHYAAVAAERLVAALYPDETRETRKP